MTTFTLLFFIIILFNPITLFYGILFLIKHLLGKSKDVYQYKIVSISLTAGIIFFHTLFFVIGLYSLRWYNLHYTLDLKIPYNFLIFWLDADVIFIVKYYCIFLVLSLVIIGLLIISKLHQMFWKEIQKIYIYYNYEDYFFFKGSTIGKVLYNFCHDALSCFAITCILVNLVEKISSYLRLKGYENLANKFRRFFYHTIFFQFGRISKKLSSEKVLLDYIIMFLPIVIFFFEIVFNNAVLHLFYYYMLFFFPLALIKKITMLVSYTNAALRDVLFKIYYTEENAIYAFLPEYEPIINYFLMNKLNKMFFILNSSDYGESLSFMIRFESSFTVLDESDLTYVNGSGLVIKKDKGVWKIIPGEYDPEENIYNYSPIKLFILADKTTPCKKDE